MCISDEGNPSEVAVFEGQNQSNISNFIPIYFMISC